MNAHEHGFLSFLAEPGRRRMQNLLGAGEKRRKDVRYLLHHAVRLDPKFCEHLEGNKAFVGSIADALRARSAPTECYVLSANSALDGREMPLRQALEQVVGMGDGAFVSCIPGRLGYFEYESIKSSYLLAKPEI